VAIGVAGMKVIHDHRGKVDAYGYKMHATEEAVGMNWPAPLAWFAEKTHAFQLV